MSDQRPPEVGDPAPDFTLPGVAGGERRDYTLSEFRGQKVVLAFYPGDFTPGCTRQMCSYRDHFDEFAGVEAVLLGISPQSVFIVDGDGIVRYKHVALVGATFRKADALSRVVAEI